MTTLSQYLKAERPDTTEPASFYAPGAEDWRQIKRVRAGLALRSRAPEETVYPVQTDDPVEH